MVKFEAVDYVDDANKTSEARTYLTTTDGGEPAIRGIDDNTPVYCFK